MEKIEILSSTDLRLQILLMKAERANQEKELDKSVKGLTQLLFIPSSMKKDLDNEPQTNKRALLNISKTLINRSTDYIVEQKFGTKHNFNDFLASMFFELISIPLISNKITEMFSQINDNVFNGDESDD